MQNLSRIILSIVLLAPLAVTAQTAKTRADLYTDVDSRLPSGTGGITAANLRLMFKDTIASVHAPLTDGTVIVSSGSYANPNWITALAYGKLTGVPALVAIATSGSASDLSAGTVPLARLSGITGAQLAANASIALTQLATDPLARANHTGSQAISTVTGLQAALDGKQAASSVLDTFTTNGSGFYLSRSNHSGAQAISTITGLQAALDAKASFSALVASNGSGPNAGDGLIHWSQIVGMPAGFSDGTDDGAGGGGGTVTSFSAGDLSPLFTTAEANATTTPALTFTLSNAAQNAVLAGPASGGSGPWSGRALVDADIPAAIARDSEVSATYAPLASPALTGTPTAPTAAPGTNTQQVATTQFVQAAVVGGSGGHVIQHNGTPVTQRANLNLIGSAVSLSDDAGNDATVVTINSSGSGSGESVKKTYTQTAHGLAAGRAVQRNSSGAWQYAADGRAQGVIESVTTNDLTIVHSGLLTGLSGLTAGDSLWANATGVLSNKPTLTGSFVQQIGTALSATEAIVRIDDPGTSSPTLPFTGQYFIFEGDSLSNDEGDGSDWPSKLMNLSQFKGRGTKYQFAASGRNLSGVVTSFNDNIRPLRPALSGVAKAWLFVWVGANDLNTSDVESWKSNWTSLMTSAKADGFTVVAFTVLRNQSGATGEAKESNRRIMNAHIRASMLPDMVIDVDIQFPNSADENYFNPDHIHLNNDSDTRLARYVNQKFAAAGLGVGQLGEAASRDVGTADNTIPTNSHIFNFPHGWNAAVGTNQQVITYSATPAWDLDVRAVARIDLTGAAAVANPTNKRAGFSYRLLAVQDSTGGRALTFGTDYLWTTPPGTAPSPNTAPNVANLYEFYCTGEKLLGRLLGSYDLGGASSLVLRIHDAFNSPGSNTSINNTAPDTVNLPGNLWSGSQTRLAAEPRLLGSTSGTAYTSINAGVSNVEVECLVFMGTATNAQGLVFRAVDSNNLWWLSINGGGDWTLFRYASGTGSTVATGTYTKDTTNGNLLKVVTQGSTVTCYIDGAQVDTRTDATYSSATRYGFRSQSNASGVNVRYDEFKVYW